MEPGESGAATGGKLGAFEVAGAEGERRPSRESRAVQEANLQVKDDQAKQLREPHRQAASVPEPNTDFNATQVIARYIDGVDTATGDFVMRFRVDRRYREQAILVGRARGVPLSVDIQRWGYHGTPRDDSSGNGAGQSSPDAQGG